MRIRPGLVLSSASVALFTACAPTAPRGVVTWGEITSQPVPAAGERIQYGSDPLQFGELRLPSGNGGPYPLAVVIHGGCWQSEYDLRHIANVSAALTRAGIATWTLEYRRIGNPGGGWPGTFEDVARGTDYLRTLAQRYPIDLDRVALVGHSAGGHLALWLAARHNLPRESPLFTADPLRVRGVVSLAGITDLRTYSAGAGNCNQSVAQLLGGSPEAVPDRYAQASPIELLPLGVPQRLIHGALDPIVPVEQSRRFEARARASGDDSRVVLLEGAGHFDVIAPFAPAWKSVEEAVRSLISAP